jgi:ribonucleoside-diphosphate reductase alpha chain
MGSYNNFRDNDKFTESRTDIYNPSFESPIAPSEEKGNIVDRHIVEFTKLCSFLRFYPDIFWDMYKPEKGGLTFDLHQRVMLRALSRFGENYFCAPRGISKTLVHVMAQYHTCCCFPNITTSITASTKESAVKIWKDKHDELLRFYPGFADNIRKANFSKDYGMVEFVNGSVIDSLANSQQSKGLRRRRGGLEESALIDKETYDDAIEPIFNISRPTMTGVIDPEELNGQINRYTTSGYKNSDEYEQILKVMHDMVKLNGSFVFGSDWRIPIHFGRQKMSTINKARDRNVIRFRQNYLCDWIGVSDGGLVNISKLMKAMILEKPELECPKDKNGKFLLNEYVISADIARSNSENNNKTQIVVLKIIRDKSGKVRQVQVVNMINPPNGLNYEEQSIAIKRIFYKYGGNLDMNKSRVKAIIIDANGVGQGVVEKLLEEQTDYQTNDELGAFATINTEDKCQPYAPKLVYALKAQGINSDIIRIFIGYVEANRLKLLRKIDDMKEDNQFSNLEASIKDEMEHACLNTQFLIDEVANLKLKKTESSGKYSVEQVVKRVDKDRWSALVYGLYYVDLFMNEEEIIEDEDDDLVYY